ncbi:GAP family protein [Pelagibacterium montanilacus]|uniref:GAP family protein n=1 Tax=Pelagibacterium montanilacus TaxID=2185280 RepID=UPI000F8D145D|nr:GAP family protein [Pelagibacterium montanilacus]
MSPGLVFALLGLAALDSTSIGTLYIPIWLMARGVATRGVLFYLACVAACYFAVGLAVLAGAESLVDVLGGAIASRAASWAMVGAGMLLMAFGFCVRQRRKAAWRERAGGPGGARGLAALAVTTVTLEFATMLPYLGAIALIGAADMGNSARTATMAVYSLAMVAPALVLAPLKAGRVGAIARWVDWLDARFAELGGGSGPRWTFVVLGMALAGFGTYRLVS